MHRFLKEEQGSILVITMIYFLIFSITGLAVLTLAAYLRSNILDKIHAVKNKYAVESTLNLALWRMNTGADSLANFTEKGGTSQYNDSTRILTVSTNQWNQPHQVTVEVEQDHPFNHGVASLVDPVTSEKSSVTTLPGHSFRKFDSLPTIDIDYYRQNAVQIYTSGKTTFKDTLPSGIHYIEGGEVRLGKGAYLSGSLVVKGTLELEHKTVTLRAITDSAGVYLPVLIVADPLAGISTGGGATIEGAVFFLGNFDMKEGTLTGPLVASSIKLGKDLVIDDQANEKYYVWPSGFGSLYSYDWPKQIKAWH